MARAIQRFEVSLKAFIVDGERALFLREADTGYWELPGGRIDVGEEWVAHTDVLAREMREELGAGFAIEFTPHVVTWTRQRPTDGVYLFLATRIGYVRHGTPQLSDEHNQLGWFTRDEMSTLRFPELSGYAAGLAQLWNLVAPT